MIGRASASQVLRARKCLKELRSRQEIPLKIGARRVEERDGWWLLGEQEAPQICPGYMLTNIWYEAIHLDAASYNLVPVIKTLPGDELTRVEKDLLIRKPREPLHLPVEIIRRVNTPPFDLTATEGVMPDDKDLVILISYPSAGTSRGHTVLVYFKECEDLKAEDAPFTRRSQRTYSVFNEELETLMVLDELASM